VNTRTGALDAVVFGVDVQSGDVRGDAPSYALVVFDGEEVERDVVSHRKLRRRIESDEPAIVATDNMYELAEDKDALVHFLGELPDETKLVQVTGAERPEPLSRVASRHGVPYAKKPMKEAEAAARLAAANVGQEVSAFTDTTEVKVSRGRSTGGGGGWSEDRFTRRIHGSVKRRAREVESELQGLVSTTRRTSPRSTAASRRRYSKSLPGPRTSPSRASGPAIPASRFSASDGTASNSGRSRNAATTSSSASIPTTTAAAVVGLDGSVLDVFSPERWTPPT